MSLLLAKGDREKNGDSRRQEAMPVYCNCRSRLMESDRMVCCIPATNGAMDPALLYHHKCGFWIVDIDACPCTLQLTCIAAQHFIYLLSFEMALSIANVVTVT